MSTNVVPFPRREIPIEELRKELMGKPRLEKELLPRFACNLGRMALKLQRDDPAAGARRMFDLAFGSSPDA